MAEEYERKACHVYDGAGALVNCYLRVTPTTVELFDCDGDLCQTFEVPRPSTDPLAAAERGWSEQLNPVRKQFDLVTGDRDRGIDALVICSRLLAELDDHNRSAALHYLQSRFGPRT